MTFAVPDTLTVPFEPTEPMWGELARDIVTWTMFSTPTGAALYKHLEMIGADIPEWLSEEIENKPFVPSKGNIAAAIYKAVLHDYHKNRLLGLVDVDGVKISTEKTVQGTKSMFPLEHTPLRPVREGVLGESVFYTEWLKLMATNLNVDEIRYYDEETTRLQLILSGMKDVVTQRHATVCASFIVWLGTNCGQCFLNQARDAKKTIQREAFLKTWAQENHRTPGLNRGLRTIEHILAPLDHFGVDGQAKIPELTASDYETVEHLVDWLEGVRGSQFLDRCQRTLNYIHEQRRKTDRDSWFAKVAKHTPLTDPE